MSGRFKVFGTFRLRVRELERLVIYGDIVQGSVRDREVILIPLNNSLNVAAEVQSVEAIDGTATGSHVALVISSEDPDESSLLEGLNLVGDTLEVAAEIDG
jgi:hypothetical protein